MEYDFNNWTPEQWENLHSTINRMVVYSDIIKNADNKGYLAAKLSLMLAMETLECYKTPKEV